MKFELILPLFVTAVLSLASGQAVWAQVQIELKSNVVQVTTPTVHIRDVVSAGSSKDEKVLALDLDSFGPAANELRISKQQIRIRLLLAGFDRIDLRGPDELRVVRVDKVDARGAIETRIQSHLATHYTIPESAIHVALSISFKLESSKNLDFSTLEIENLANPDIPLGRQTFVGSVQDSTGLTQRVNIPVEVALYRELAVAKQDISRGTLLTTENIQSVRRLVTTKQQAYLTLNHALGKQANADIDMYALLKRTSVKTNVARTAKLMQKNRFVDAVLRRGRLTVTLKDVKTLQDGDKGDVIQVLNLNNKETLHARVIDANTVQLR